ncbi:MAG: hypothetical protein KGJ90_04755, partial [Patescibacteria group bacterium]|nr:hypothetical protein [Patescibacteria group bacterium]
MKKIFLALILAALGGALTGFTAQAITCSTVFPTSLDNYTAGQCIPSAWANALESAIGVTNSSVVTSLEYKVGQAITTTTGNWAGTWQSKNPSDFLSSSTAYISSVVSANGFITTSTNGTVETITASTSPIYPQITVSGTTTLSTLTSELLRADGNHNVAFAGISSPLNFDGTTLSCPTCLTSAITSINNGAGSGGNYSILAGTNITITTTTTSTVINSTASGGGGLASTTPWTLGSLVIASSGTQVTTLATGTPGYVLQATGTSPYEAWVSTSSLGISGGGGNPLTTGNTPTIQTSAASSTSFSYIGATTSWVVPTGVTSITISATGGTGGAAGSNTSGVGTGGSVTGTLAVTGGSTYYISVGQGGLGATTTAAYGGGGQGGANTANGGGGGCTWFSSSSSFSTSTVLVVAAGGGGNSYGSVDSGGGGGGVTGVNGATGGGGGAGGGGGTQTSGGAGGTGTSNGTSGTAGQGGNGGASTNSGGGGGGCGYYGGGGGAGMTGFGGAGGGGGSSYFSSTLTSTSTASGTVSTSITNGANGTNGSLTISYSLPVNVTTTGTNYAGSAVSPTNDTAFTVKFASPNNFVNGESCGVTPNNATNSAWISYNATTSFTVNFQNALTTNQSFNYWCLG